MKIRAYFTGVFFVICVYAEALAFVGAPCEIAKGWVAMEVEKKGDNKALFDLDASAISIGQPFSFNVSLCGESGVKPDRVTVNAIMPAHQHGMNYMPTVSYIEDSSSYKAEGFLFHMPGVWLITVASYVGEDVTHYTKSITKTATHLLLTQQELSQTLAHGPWPLEAKPDPSNKLSGNIEAIELGRRLFFSTRLSGDNTKSCVSCHSPNDAFASGRVIKENPNDLDRNTIGLLNVRYNRWFGWDGGNDNLWAQSIRPIVNSKEMNLPKQALRSVIQESTFAKPYSRLYGDIAKQSDEKVLVNIGKALAAFQETLVTPKTPFDQFRDAVANKDWETVAKYPKSSQRGLSLFLGKGNCIFCHSGPLFSNGEFHDAGVPYFIRPGEVDRGRHQGIIDLKKSPFTLASDYSDDPKKAGAWKVNKVVTSHSNFGIFRVPSLRNIANTAPYMHNGSLANLEAVVDHYSNINIERLHADGEAILKPLNLSYQEIADLVSFLKTL